MPAEVFTGQYRPSLPRLFEKQPTEDPGGNALDGGGGGEGRGSATHHGALSKVPNVRTSVSTQQQAQYKLGISDCMPLRLHSR